MKEREETKREKKRKGAPSTKPNLQQLREDVKEIILNINILPIITEIITDIYNLIDEKKNIEDIKNIFKNIENSYFAFDYEIGGKTITYYILSYPYYTEYNNYKILKCDEKTYKEIRDYELNADRKTRNVRNVRERLIDNIYNSIRYYFDNKNYLFKYSFENKFTLDYRDYDIIKKRSTAEGNILNFYKSAVYTLSKKIDSDDKDDDDYAIYEYLKGQNIDNIDSIDSIDHEADTYEYNFISKIIKKKILSTEPRLPLRRRRVKPKPSTPREYKTEYTDKEAQETRYEIRKRFDEIQGDARDVLKKSQETLSNIRQNPPTGSPQNLGTLASPRQSRPTTASQRGPPTGSSQYSRLSTASQERRLGAYAYSTASSRSRTQQTSASREGRTKSPRKDSKTSFIDSESDSSLNTETLLEEDSTNRLSSPRTQKERSPSPTGWGVQNDTSLPDIKTTQREIKVNTPRIMQQPSKTPDSGFWAEKPPYKNRYSSRIQDVKDIEIEELPDNLPRIGDRLDRKKVRGGEPKDDYYIIVPCFKRGVEIYYNNGFNMKIETIYDIINGVKNKLVNGKDKEFTTQKLITFNENIHLEISEELFKKHEDIKGLILNDKFYLKPLEELYLDENNINLGLFSKKKDYDNFTFKNETNKIIE